MNNTSSVEKHNTGSSTTNYWHESSFFRNLQKERQLRFAQIEEEGRTRQAKRQLQQTILQLLIDADHKPVHIDTIADHIGHPRQRIIEFLINHDDELWIAFGRDISFWITSLRRLPDRLFY